MKPEHSSQDELQRVLALKRHEQPPRKFFKGFAEKVMDRLQNPEPPPEPTLMQRLGLDLDTKPVLICLSGLAVCGLLAYGLISSRNMKAPPPDATNPLGSRPVHRSPGVDAPGLMPTPPVNQEESSGSSEPIIVAPEPGQRIPPRPRPASVAPGNPGK